jgi:hypothetical protein
VASTGCATILIGVGMLGAAGGLAQVLSNGKIPFRG